MTSEDNRDRKFVERLSSDPGLVATAFGLVEDEYQGTDRLLLARRILEQELRTGPDGAGEWVYREVAGQLAARGHRGEANALRRVADTSAVLAAADVEWRGRYLSRPATANERLDLSAIEENRVRPVGQPAGPGADGAFYTPAVRMGWYADESPVVIVTTDAGIQEVVGGFGSPEKHADWIADRLRTGPREGTPGATGLRLESSMPGGGPACRTSREERALAWLLRGGAMPGDPESSPVNRHFISSIRSEIYLAWRDTRDSGRWGTRVVREELERRMLRAPGWAAPVTGWPFGQRAMAYFDRLAATPVSESLGRDACQRLAQEDLEALRAARDAGPAQPQAGRAAQHPSYGTGPGLLEPPRPDDPSPGFGPRI